MDHTRTLDTIFLCAENCRTYRQFCKLYPQAHDLIREHGWIDQLAAHCGWVRYAGVAVHVPKYLYPQDLHETLEEDDVFFYEALSDPFWPYNDVKERVSPAPSLVAW